MTGVHDVAPFLPWLDQQVRDAPGMRPLRDDPWLIRDACFATHMAQRDNLIATGEDIVAEGGEAALELLEQVIAHVASDPGYTVDKGQVIRPDGICVPIDPVQPLRAIGRLVQEDFLILEGQRGGHILTSGVLCFPSHWTLSEKLGRDLLRIHAPVPFYADNLAPRVQRFFDALHPERPLWRLNWLFYPSTQMHTPEREGIKATKRWNPNDPIYLRSERQVLKRLPRSNAVVFSIKTDLTPLTAIPTDALIALIDALTVLPPVEAAYKSRDDVLRAIQINLTDRTKKGPP